MATSTGVVLAYLHNETVSASWHESVQALRDWDEKYEHYIWGNETGGGRIRSWCSSEGLVRGRNLLVKDFLEQTSTEWLLWVDTDMGFEPDTLARMMEVADPVERPIIGALCFAQKMPFTDTMGGFKTIPIPTIYSWTREDGFRPALGYPVNTLVRCQATGSAAILIHRSVFEKIHEKYGRRWYDKLPDPLREDDVIGEDLSFCLRAGTCGIPVYVHTGIRTTHHKPIWVNEQDYWNHMLAPPANEQVAVLVPTDRPDGAEVLMQTLRASTGLATAYALVSAEDETAAAWRAAGAEVIVEPGWWSQRVNRALGQVEEPWIFLTNDDVKFHPGWFDQAVAVSVDRCYRVIGVNDFVTPVVQAGEHAFSVLVDREYAVTEGASWDGPGLAHEGYRYWFLDEIVAAAKQRGVWAMALGSTVERPPEDEGWGRPPMAKDQQLFERRIKERFGQPKAVPA